MTEPAHEAFEAQIEATAGSVYIFPGPSKKAKKPYVTSLRRICEKALRQAGVSYFPIYRLRSTFATRLCAGGAADHLVTQMLRQGDSRVFKRYSQARLMIMREALQKLVRKANEYATTFSTTPPK